MVAKVISGQDIKGALNYNEQKVMEGKATCIQANLFKREAGDLNFYEKLIRFTDLNERNMRTKTNTLHISLNFDRTEKLGGEVLNRIATQYMDKIGFGNQPYLVYEHTDAAHPHIHIVSTLIKEDGKRIPIHYLGKNESEKARKEIENEFGLVQAQSKSNEYKELINPVDVSKAIYGKSETKQSIVNIVRMVTRTYKYCSLPELNAVLRQYNVVAERGTEKSKMFARKGLMYSILDKKGKRVGIPVKASAIYGKPTLLFLEKQFNLNRVLRVPFRESLKKAVDKTLGAQNVTTKEKFISELEKVGVAVCFRTNAEGRTYGVTFVDNKSKVVFNGSDLGKPYSANAIIGKLSVKKDAVKAYLTKKDSVFENSIEGVMEAGSSVVMDLVVAEDFDRSSPEAALRLGRRRRKRKGRRL